jgi:hypothetical protein
MTFQEVLFILHCVASELSDSGKEYDWFPELKRPWLSVVSSDSLDDV